MAMLTKTGSSLKGPIESSVQHQYFWLTLLVAAFLTGISASTTSSFIQSLSTATRTQTFTTQIITQPKSTAATNLTSSMQSHHPQSIPQSNHHPPTAQSIQPKSTIQNGELQSTTRSNQAQSATQSEQAQTTTQNGELQSTTQNSQPLTTQNQIRPTTQHNQIKKPTLSNPIHATLQSNQAQSTTQENQIQTTIQSSQQLPTTKDSHLSLNTEGGLLISSGSKTIQSAQSSDPTSTPQSNQSQSNSSNDYQIPSATSDNLALSIAQIIQDSQSSFSYQIIQEAKLTPKLTASDIQPSWTFSEQNLQSFLTPELIWTLTSSLTTTTETTHAPTTQSARLSKSLNSTALNTPDWLPPLTAFDSLDDKDESYSSMQIDYPSTTPSTFTGDSTNTVFSSNRLQYHIEESNTFTTTNDGASHITPSSMFVTSLDSSDGVPSGFEEKFSTESFLSETHISPNTGFIIPFDTTESPIDSMFSGESTLSPPSSKDICGDDRHSSIIDAHNLSFSSQNIYNATSVEAEFISITDYQFDVSDATRYLADESSYIDSPKASIEPDAMATTVSCTDTIDCLDGNSLYVMDSSYPSFSSMLSTPPLIYTESTIFSIEDESINGTTHNFVNVSNSTLKTLNLMLISQTSYPPSDTQVSLIASPPMDEGYSSAIIDTLSADDLHTDASSVINMWFSDGPTSAATDDLFETQSFPFLLPSQPLTQQSDMSLFPSLDSSSTKAHSPRMEISVSSTHSSIDHSERTTTETTLVPARNKTTTLRFALKGKCLIMARNESSAETLSGFLYLILNTTNGFKNTSLLDLQPCEPFNITVQIPVKIKNQTNLFGDYMVNITLIHKGHNHIFIINVEKVNSSKLSGSNSVMDLVITYTASCICGVLLVLFVGFLVRQAFRMNGLSSWRCVLTRCWDVKAGSVSLTVLPRSGSSCSEMRDNGSITGHVTPSFGVYSTVENETEATTSFMKKTDLRRSPGRSGKDRRSLTKKIKPSANGQGYQQSIDPNKRPYGLVIGLMGIKSTKDDHVYAVPKKAHKKRKVYGLAVRPTTSVPKPSIDHNPRASFDSPMATSQPSDKPSSRQQYHRRYLKYGEVNYSQENLVPGKQGERRANVESGMDNPCFDDYDSDKSTHI